MAVDDQYTKALLHFDGTDASTTFLDETGKIWTAAGNAQIDTAQSVFGGASGLFDGTGDIISTPDHANWQLDGGSNSNTWTIDFWVRFNGDPGTGVMGFLQQRAGGNDFWAIRLSANTFAFLVRSGGTNIVSIAQTWNPATATWYHNAIVKDGTNGYMHFVDGVQIGSTTTDVSPIPDFAAALWVADYQDSTGAHNYFNGWMEELRISIGIARWTANFTPPTLPYGRPDGSFFALFFHNWKKIGGILRPPGYGKILKPAGMQI
jgi:hypothetical protein